MYRVGQDPIHRIINRLTDGEPHSKEGALTKFYKKPAKCDGNPNNETMTECANDYIRSKRQFEVDYAAGKL